MDVFELTIKVTKDHLDALQHVNNVQYVEWVQDIAREHWQQKSNQSLNNQFFWVLLDHHIQYKDQAVLGDLLKLKTFVTKSEGVKSYRTVEFYKDEDLLICKSETQWCLISKESNKPTRINTEIANLFS